MYKVEEKKWRQFPPDVQLKNIAAELARASHANLYNTESKKEQAVSAYERALMLIDASLNDPQWKDREFLHELRDAVAALYVGTADSAISRLISSQLLAKNKIL